MNCKPGDLAIVIGGAVLENIGKIVRVVKLSMTGDLIDEETTYVDDSPAWLVAGNLWTFDLSGRHGHYTTILHYADCFLKPLPSVPITDDIDTEIPA